MPYHRAIVAALGVALVLPACGKSSVTLTGYAKQKWETLCVTCHGETGQGDGPKAAELKVKPRRFGDAAWQDSVDDAAIRKIILEGGAAVGKSPDMPANEDLVQQQEALSQLIKKVRSFAP
ncbi:MAG: c-type cytochrome [Deltaproteobacteria bacterium]|nr:c-type cytochrome [Deltaproteobacteria bacterium]